MNAKLAIIANERERVLDAEAKLSIEMQNPLFNATEMFSYPIELPIDGNRDMLKNVDDPDSDIRPISLEHTPMRIIADGIPFASGPMVITEDERVKDSMNVNIDSAVEDFSSMIGDLVCKDVPIPEADKTSLIIGEKIANVEVEATYDFKVWMHTKKSGKSDSYEVTRTLSFPEETVKATYEPQALGFSYPGRCKIKSGSTIQEAEFKQELIYNDGSKRTVPVVEESYINVTDEYKGNKRNSSQGGAKYCNARVCYKHYDKDADGTTSNKIVEVDKQNNNKNAAPEDHGKWWVLEADRPQSGICFYVLYFLECLFKHLNVNYDISALMEIEDMKHLLFFTTKCAYDIQHTDWGGHLEKFDETGAVIQHASYFFQRTVDANNRTHLFDDVNKWLSSRGCGGKLELEPIEGADINEVTIGGRTYQAGKDYQEIKVKPNFKGATMKANIVQMVANSENFPDMSVSSLLDSLENMFGIKFSYDYEQKKVTAYLIRNVFRKQDVPRKFHAQVLDITKVTEKITGVRVGYSTESDSKEQRNNIRYGVRDYDTNFDYIDYPHPITGGERSTIYNLKYEEFFRTKATAGNYHVYIDPQTGNAYRVKVNGDATEFREMKPAFFEVGGYKGVEEGDCSPINEDFVREMISDLQPMIFNDVNFEREVNFWEDAENPKQGIYDDGQTVNVQGINASDKQSLLAAFVDEDMEHEFIEQRIRQNLASAYVNLYFTEVLNLVESYDPTKTDDGNSPLQTYDWGNAIAMMRGGGADADITQFDTNYDGFGNNKWAMTNGVYALTSDTMDQFGVQYDYNGKQDGIGSGERFSLKPRAYKQPEWAEGPLCIADPAVRNRGYVDTFLIEYIHFLLHRKKYAITCLCSVAQLADIPNHWKEWWLIDNKKCLINKVNTDISVKDGISEVELEVYSL